MPYLEEIWRTKILSNHGPFAAELEAKIGDYLGLENISLFENATLALMVAQKALDVSGEIITTPYTFAATTHAITWMNNKPVFVDVDPESLTLSPTAVEAAITESTRALMPLHCYGNTCDTDALAEIAEKYHLKIIYDACHSFGVEDSGGSVLRHGDVSVVSFHATKVFNTFEGGMVVCKDSELKRKVDQLKNFGFLDEITIVEPGINGKMSEFNAAVGLAQVAHLDRIIKQRKAIDQAYRAALAAVKGIECMSAMRQKVRNYAYFPVFVRADFTLTRDELYEALKLEGIYARRYFYPIVPNFESYKNTFSDVINGLPVAFTAAQQVLCLPIYPDLKLSDVERICHVITKHGQR